MHFATCPYRVPTARSESQKRNAEQLKRNVEQKKHNTKLNRIWRENKSVLFLHTCVILCANLKTYRITQLEANLKVKLMKKNDRDADRCVFPM